MKWINPEHTAPDGKQRVLTAVGIPCVVARPEYKVATYDASGWFKFNNGPYGDSGLRGAGYSDGTCNANRVLAWAAIDEFDGEFCEDDEDERWEGDDDYRYSCDKD